MALRLFADHCVSNEIVKFLNNMGHEVIQLREIMPHDSSDLAVISKAKELGSILVSLNGDFTDIVTYPPANYSGIIALQIRNRPQAILHILERLNRYLVLFPNIEDYYGKLILVEAHRVRVKT